MASRNTLDTNLLRIRNVTAYNPTTSDFIQPAQIPVIGQQGSVTWLSSLEFLSSISVPRVSCSVLTILNTVQPGISTMSTITASTVASHLVSTVTGLGTSLYVSTTYLELELDFLSVRHGSYISSTTMYDVINNLSNLQYIKGGLGTIGVGPIPTANFDRPDFTGGYVYTQNPGYYTRFQSSLLGGTQKTSRMTADTNVQGSRIDLGGYVPSFVNTSKLTIDVFNGATVTFDGGAAAGTSFSTFLLSTNTVGMVGEPVVYKVSTTATSLSIPATRFYIPQSMITLTNIPASLTVAYRTNADNATLFDNVPTVGGLFVTLDNTD